MPHQATTLPRWLSWAKRGGFAILDQGLFSGANFIVNILLARWLEPAQYGAFAVAYSVFLLFAAFHSAVLTEPMMVFGAGKYAEKFRKYLGILIYGHWGITGIIALTLGLTALVYWQLGSGGMPQLLAGLAVASLFILLLWLLRRAFYVRIEPQWAATGGALYVVLMLAGMYGLYRTAWLSAPLALVVMGFASLTVSLWLSTLLQPQWALAESNPTPRMVLADHWGYGKWSTATTILTWAQSNIYYMFLPVWVGLDGSGALRATMNLAMPVLHMQAAASGLLVPAFVRILGSKGKTGLRRSVIQLFILSVLGWALYWGLLFSLRHELLAWLYGGKYGQYANLLLLVGCIPLFLGMMPPLGSALRAMERPDQIFWANVVSTLVALTLGLWLLATKGVVGAVAGQLAAAAALAAVVMWSYTSQSTRPDGNQS